MADKSCLIACQTGFNMEDKVVTLLNELWDKMRVNTTARRPVEFTCEDICR